MYCMKCGKEIPDAAVFCPNCGYSSKSSNYSSKLQRTGSILSLVSSVLFVVLSAIALIWSAFIIDEQVEQTNNSISSDADITIHSEITIGNEDGEVKSKIAFLCGGVISAIITILCILYIKNIIKSKYIFLYGLSVSILNIIQIILMMSLFGCCQVVFLVMPISSLIGSILILIGTLKQSKREEQKCL